MREVKQVIVMRKDLKMRRGKEIAQGSHGSLGSLLDQGKIEQKGKKKRLIIEFDEGSALDSWLTEKFRKICVYVNSEEELLDIYNKAVRLRLPCALIKDAGDTEFKGVPTLTCCAIGPDFSDKIDEVTKSLNLY